MKISTVTAIIVTALLAGASFFAGYRLRRPGEITPSPGKDTVWRWIHDTTWRVISTGTIGYIWVTLPAAHQDTTLADNANLLAPDANLPAADAKDSVTVEVPIEQKTYQGEYYTAVVRGFQPELVSIDFRFPEVVAEKRKWWSVTIGLQMGYGFTPAGWQPYTGIGGSVGLSFTF